MFEPEFTDVRGRVEWICCCLRRRHCVRVLQLYLGRQNCFFERVVLIRNWRQNLVLGLGAERKELFDAAEHASICFTFGWHIHLDIAFLLLDQCELNALATFVVLSRLVCYFKPIGLLLQIGSVAHPQCIRWCDHWLANNRMVLNATRHLNLTLQRGMDKIMVDNFDRASKWIRLRHDVACLTGIRNGLFPELRRLGGRLEGNLTLT